MFKVYYKGETTPFFIGEFETRIEAEVFMIEDLENEMIKSAEIGELDNMNHNEKWDFYGAELSRYAVHNTEFDNGIKA
jgi:hypothetical protein